MTAANSAAPADRVPHVSAGFNPLALLGITEQNQPLAIVGMLVAAVLIAALPAWIKARYRYWGVIESQQIKYRDRRSGQAPKEEDKNK